MVTRGTAQRRGSVADLVLGDRRGVRVGSLAGIILLGLFRIGIGGRGARGVPLDLERVASGTRRFDGVANHSDAEGQRDHPGHALHLADLVAIEDFHLGAFHRRFQHRGVDHPRHLNVDAVSRRAVGLRRDVDAADFLAADQLELICLLQIRFADLGRFAGDRREFDDVSIGDTPPRLAVHDEAFVGRELARRHFPFVGDVVDQDASRLSAGHAQRHEVAGNGDAGGGDLRAFEQLVRIAVELWVGGGELAFHLRPVGVELLG
jgi:hypothetical protein